MRLLLLNLFIFLLPTIFCGNTESDSLAIINIQAEIETAVDTQKLRLLNEYSWNHRAANNKIAEAWAREGRDLAQQLGDSTQFHLLGKNLGVIWALQSKFEEGVKMIKAAESYFSLLGESEKLIKILTVKAALLTYKGDYTLAEDTYQILTGLLKDQPQSSDYLNVLLERGLNFHYWQKYALAQEYYLKALPLSESLSDTITTQKLLMNLGLIASEEDRFSEALDFYFKAIPAKGDDFFLARLYNNIGTVYENIQDFEEAIDYHEKSLVLKRKLGFPRNIAASLNNLANIHKEKKNYGQALALYQESLAIKKQLEGTNNDLSANYANIGLSYATLKDFKKAEPAFLSAIEASIRENNLNRKAEAINNLADIYMFQGRFEEGINYGLQSLQIAEELHDYGTIKHSSMILSECYRGLGQYQKANSYLKQHLEAKDSLAAFANLMAIRKMESQFRLVQKDRELATQEALLTNLQEKEILQTQRNLFLWIGLISWILIATLVFFYQKQKIHKTQKEQELSATQAEAAQLKVQLLEEELSKNQWALDNYLKNFIDKTELLEKLNRKLVTEIGEQRVAALDNLSILLKDNLISDNNYETFQYYFSLVHRDFFKKLTQKYGPLSAQELNLCALIKINMVNKDIAKIFGISPDSVKKARHRLYKKLNLPNNNALRTAIMEL